MKAATFTIFLLLIFSAFYTEAQDMKFSSADIDIPYEKYVLPNGLRLIVHEDHKAPIAAVNVWYHVGSKNEKEGKSGFAHLFEHLMFNGSEHFNDDYFQALERIGGTDLNGTTNNDRTNYFQNVPLAGLEQVLWLESDRMGHLLGAIDQAKLDEQRGVVQNEKRQGENQPYGQQYNLITKAMFPKGHPYSWTVIGEMEDLNAASLEDVQQWFNTYYGAANAVIVVAGDVNPEEVYQKTMKYFGHIGSGPKLSRPEVDIPERTVDTRMSYQDRVPESRIVMCWNTPEYMSKEDALLDLAASILTTGKNSRLYKRLIYNDQTASSVNAFQWSKEIAGNFIIQANVKPGESLEEVEQTLIDEVKKFLDEGPTNKELNRAKSQYFANFIKGIERIGGFGGKSDILAQYEVYAGTPDFYKTILSYIENATPEDIQSVCKKWLAKGKHTLICTPFPDYSTEESIVDRTTGLPALGEPVAAKFPDIQRKRLPNGMEIVLAQRKDVPTVVMDMIFDAGYAADQFVKPGTASLAMDMLDEGAQSMTSLEISEKLQMLGASLNSYASLDASHISMNTLKPTLEESMALYSNVVRHPSFPQAEFERLKKERLADIQREKANPVQMAIRVMPKFLYGEGHAYSMPLTGTGDEKSVFSMSLTDMRTYYQDWIQPNNATLCVVGDIAMDELIALVEDHFGDWEKGIIKKKDITRVDHQKGGSIYIMDRPESLQSVIIAGYLVPSYGEISEVAKDAMLSVLGGDFTSRINMNLREDKHWSYGAGAFILDAKGQRPMLAFASVQTDKTPESMQEIIKEYKEFIGMRPMTVEEFEKTTQNTILKLPGTWETNSAVLRSLSEIIQYDLAEDYYKKYDGEVRNLTVEEVRLLSKEIVRPGDLSFFVVGDKAKILSGLEALDMKVVQVDTDGNELKKTKKVRP